MAGIKVDVNTELLEDVATRVLQSLDGLESGEFDPEEITARAGSIVEAAEEWKTYITAEFDR